MPCKMTITRDEHEITLRINGECTRGDPGYYADGWWHPGTRDEYEVTGAEWWYDGDYVDVVDFLTEDEIYEAQIRLEEHRDEESRDYLDTMDE